MDTINVAAQIPVLDADSSLQAGCWLPPSEAVAPFSFALEPHRQREVKCWLNLGIGNIQP